jgi:hypothetical protein
MADEKDPIADMLAVDDEAMRGKALPEAELNTDAPEDKKPVERDESGKFKGEEKPQADEKKPEVKAEEKKRTDDTVPLAKYMEEKRSLKAELEARDLTIKQFNEKLAALEAKLPKPEVAPEPDFVEDPKGYVDHKQKAILEAIAEANKKAETAGSEAKETASQAAEQVQLQRFFGDLQQHEQQFIAQNPDYHDALNHVRNVRAAQIREFSPEATEQQIVEVIRNEERQLAVNLARQGRDPVQIAYNLAKHYGYQPKAKTEAKVEALKLPEPESKRLPPDQTLGSGAGAPDVPYKEGETDPVDTALASLFPKQRRA